MLDTVILQIPINYHAIIDHERFKPSTRGILDYPRPFWKCVNNATEEQKRKWGYMPRLTAIKRKRVLFLKIEFSVPNLLFGNNLDELEETDFDRLIIKLRDVVMKMGIMLYSRQIEKAEVLAFHPSKNALLTNGYTSAFAIRELNKIDVSKKLDLDKTKYRNGGEVLQIYSNSYTVVLYDKINDLNKPAKRAIDKDQTKKQISLFEHLKNQMEVLRIEIRLSKRKKMNETLEKIGFSKNPSFEDIFKKELCQKILRYYWEYFFRDNLFLFDVRNNPQTILNLILTKLPDIGIKKAIYFTGFLSLCKDDEGMRGFRNIAESYKPKTNWSALKKWLKDFQNYIEDAPLHGFIKDIEKALDEFKPFKLGKSYPHLQCKLL